MPGKNVAYLDFCTENGSAVYYPFEISDSFSLGVEAVLLDFRLQLWEVSVFQSYIER